MESTPLVTRRAGTAVADAVGTSADLRASATEGKGSDRVADALTFLAGGGEAARLIRARDWSGHPLGPPESWHSMRLSCVT